MKERHARLLGRYAEQVASLAEDLHAAALSAETAEEKQSFALAFHRMGRALRQTLALEARLRRDAEQDRRLDADRAEQAAKARTAARKSRIKNAVERLIWTEVEEVEQVDYLQLLANRLADEDLDDPEEPLDALIHRVAADIGISPPPCGEGAGGGGAGSQLDAPGSCTQPSSQGGGRHPHPNPSPQGGGDNPIPTG